MNELPSAHVYMIVAKDLKKKELQKLYKIGAFLVRQNSKKMSGVLDICYLKRSFLRKGDKPGSVILKKDPKILRI